MQTGPEIDEIAPNPKGEGAQRPDIVSSGSDQTDAAIRSVIAFETFTMQERLAYIEHHLEYQ